MRPKIKNMIIINCSSNSVYSQHGYRVTALMKRDDASDEEFKKQLLGVHECIDQVHLFGKWGLTVSIEAIFGIAGVWPYIDDKVILAICARAGWDPATVEIQRQVDNDVVETTPAGEYVPAEDMLDQEVAACHGNAEDAEFEAGLNEILNAAHGESE